MNAPVLISVGERRLAFRYGQELEHPKDGLFLFGPLDDRAHPPQLRFGVIGTAACVARFNRWSQRIRGFIPSPEPSLATMTSVDMERVSFKRDCKLQSLTDISSLA